MEHIIHARSMTERVVGTGHLRTQTVTGRSRISIVCLILLDETDEISYPITIKATYKSGARTDVCRNILIVLALYSHDGVAVSCIKSTLNEKGPVIAVAFTHRTDFLFCDLHMLFRLCTGFVSYWEIFPKLFD